MTSSFYRSNRHEICALGIGILLGLFLLMITGCKSIMPLPVLMQTELGQPVEKTEPQRTGDRKNVPAGVKPADVVAHMKTKSGAETWIDKKGNVYQNEQAKKENDAPPDRPERSWAWAWWTIGILAALFAIDRMLNSFFGMNPFGALCRMIKKLFRFGGKA